jgi:transposase
LVFDAPGALPHRDDALEAAAAASADQLAAMKREIAELEAQMESKAQRQRSASFALVDVERLSKMQQLLVCGEFPLPPLPPRLLLHL